MPRKLGPRHARSRHTLATVNRMASAANDIQRLAWHDHQTADGEGAHAPFVPGAPTLADRQVARHLAALWLFTRRLAERKVTSPLRDAALAHVDALYALDKASAKVAGREVFPEQEYEAVRRALVKLAKMPRAETARAISHTLARIARRRCNWNANAAYRKSGKWAQGALWTPPVATSAKVQARYGEVAKRRAEDAELARLAAERRQQAAEAAKPGKKKGGKKAPAAAKPIVLPGGGVPGPDVGDEIDPETALPTYTGADSIFARRRGS